jgi:hypothetical protein
VVIEGAMQPSFLRSAFPGSHMSCFIGVDA